MSNLKDFIYLSEEQLSTLAQDGSVTANGVTVTDDIGNIYFVPDDGEGSVDTSNLVTLDGDQTIQGTKNFEKTISVKEFTGVMGDEEELYTSVAIQKDRIMFDYPDDINQGLMEKREVLTRENLSLYSMDTQQGVQIEPGQIVIDDGMNAENLVLKLPYESDGSGYSERTLATREWVLENVSGVDLSNYVTINGEETITGVKTFADTVTVLDGDLNINNGAANISGNVKAAALLINNPGGTTSDGADDCMKLACVTAENIDGTIVDLNQLYSRHSNFEIRMNPYNSNGTEYYGQAFRMDGGRTFDFVPKQDWDNIKASVYFNRGIQAPKGIILCAGDGTSTSRGSFECGALTTASADITTLKTTLTNHICFGKVTYVAASGDSIARGIYLFNLPVAITAEADLVNLLENNTYCVNGLTYMDTKGEWTPMYIYYSENMIYMVVMSSNTGTNSSGTTINKFTITSIEILSSSDVDIQPKNAEIKIYEQK